MATLSRRQQLFIDHYLRHGNATAAARDAGYSPRAASGQGVRLLRNAQIRRAVARAMAETDLSSARTLEELRRLALVDIRGYFDESGNLKPMHALTPEQGACLAAVEVVSRRTDGESIEDVRKIRLWPKLKALELLARHFQLITADAPAVAVAVRVEHVYAQPAQPGAEPGAAAGEAVIVSAGPGPEPHTCSLPLTATSAEPTDLT